MALTPEPDWVSPSELMAVPEDAQGQLFFRKQDTIIHLTETGSRYYQGQTVRILNSQALQAGNIQLAWNPAAGRPEVHSIKIRRGPRVIDVLENSTFEILRREDQLETAVLDGMLTAVLQVPDLRVGDDLEFAYTVPLHDPTLGATSHGLLLLGQAPPAGRFKIQLSWEDGQEPTTKLTEDLAPIAQRGSNSIAMRFDNPDVLTPPRDAPPRYQWSRILEFSDFEDWSAASKRFHTLFDTASNIAPDSPLKDEAALIAETHDNKLQQAQAALDLVQQQIRYVYVGLNGGNYTPATADTTWERRYGDCKGKTVTLLALLSELGIDAEAVLVANNLSNDGMDQRLANPGHFDHVLVRAKIEGKTYWLDGTLPAVIDGRNDPYFRYQWVLPLSAEGTDLERLPERPMDLAQTMGLVEIDARAGFEKPSRVTQTSVTRGPEGLQDYFRYSSVTANQLQAAFKQQYDGTEAWDNIEKVEYRYDKETQASILKITGMAPVDWEETGNDGYMLTLPGGGFYPPRRRFRPGTGSDKVPFHQSLDYTCYVTTVRLPDDTSLKNWDYNGVFDTNMFGKTYYRMMELNNDRSLRMVRGSRVERAEIGPEEAKRDNERIDRFNSTTAVLFYDPDLDDEYWETKHKVPATFELDWTGKDAPCLPPDTLK
ncbi:MAG: DUF3857 domain-containing protein [Pseudomonadota bacterium]